MLHHRMCGDTAGHFCIDKVRRTAATAPCLLQPLPTRAALAPHLPHGIPCVQISFILDTQTQEFLRLGGSHSFQRGPVAQISFNLGTRMQEFLRLGGRPILRRGWAAQISFISGTQTQEFLRLGALYVLQRAHINSACHWNSELQANSLALCLLVLSCLIGLELGLWSRQPLPPIGTTDD